MHSARVPLLLLLLLAIAATPHALGKEIRIIYLKNNGIGAADIWVNGAFQGWVPAGELVFVDKLGFVTWDSDRLQADGTRSPRKESHGGWSGDGEVTVTICQCKKDKPYKMEVKLPKEWGVEIGQGPEADPRIWFGEGSSGEEPTSGFYEAKPIEKAVEGYDCGVDSAEGVARSNYVKPKVVVAPTGWRCFAYGNLHDHPGQCSERSGGLWEWPDGFRGPIPVREMNKEEAQSKGLNFTEIKGKGK